MTDAVVDEFMSVRPLEWQGNPKVPRADIVVPGTTASAEAGEGASDGKMTKSQQKRMLKEQQTAAKKAEKAAAREKAKDATGE